MRSGSTAQAGPRPADYHTQARPEVAALVPATCRRVLDVGCGEGALGALLRSRGHTVLGVELLPGVAARARCRLDGVVVADADRALPFAPESFDAVVFADLLEHLIDPWQAVRSAARLLVPDGIVVASVPNVQNWDVVHRLARGRWDYRERGILDRGHLRFFTEQSARKLFTEAGLTVQSVGYRYRPTWMRSLLTLVTAGQARHFLARQILLVALRPGPARVGA